MTDKTPDRETGGSGSADIHDFPIFGVPASAMRRFHAKVLAPDGAELRGDEEPPHPTVYRPDRLILPGLPRSATNNSAFDELRSLGEDMGFTAVRLDDP